MEDLDGHRLLQCIEFALHVHEDIVPGTGNFGETMRIVAQATDDAKEGRAAFAEGRAPRWRGR